MTAPTDEAQRIRGYLISQANKLGIPDLVEKVRKDTAPLQEIGAAVPVAHFADRPGPDDWSAAEVYTHILEMNEFGARAIESILDGGSVPQRARDVISGDTRAELNSAEKYWQAFLS